MNRSGQGKEGEMGDRRYVLMNRSVREKRGEMETGEMSLEQEWDEKKKGYRDMRYVRKTAGLHCKHFFSVFEL